MYLDLHSFALDTHHSFLYVDSGPWMPEDIPLWVVAIPTVLTLLPPLYHVVDNRQMSCPQSIHISLSSYTCPSQRCFDGFRGHSNPASHVHCQGGGRVQRIARKRGRGGKGATDFLRLHVRLQGRKAEIATVGCASTSVDPVPIINKYKVEVGVSWNTRNLFHLSCLWR